MAFDLTIQQTLKIGTDDTEVVTKRTWRNLTTRWVREDVVQNATAVLWTAATMSPGPLTTWRVLVLTTDVDVEVQMTVNDGDANEELNHFLLESSHCFVLGSQAARYNHSASNAFGGTLDVIDHLSVKEVNNVAATVELRLYA